MHVNGALALVAAGRFARRRFLITGPGAQVLACAGALAVQEVALWLTLMLVGYRDFFVGSLAGVRGLELVFTALLPPLMFALLKAADKAMERRGWRLAGARFR